MAFNPFEAFSIRSKLGRAVMAILGIVVMLTFVLSTGAVGSRNDFFDQIGHMFTGKGKGDVVAVAYGDDIHDVDLREIRRQRQAANAFLITAIDAAYMNWARDLKQGLDNSKLSSEVKQVVSQFVDVKLKSDKDQRAYFAYLNNQQQLSRLMIANILTKPEATEDRKALDGVFAILAHDLTASNKMPPPVFPDMMLETDRDRLDFAVLLKKADRLGMNYSRDAVRELINRETGGRLSREEIGIIEKQVRGGGRFGDFGTDWLLDAIGNEYRARDAFAAFQGQSPIVTFLRDQRAFALTQQFRMAVPDVALAGDGGPMSAMPGGITPHEFWEFYKDRCSEHTFAVLELSAEKFIDQVKGEPTPKERVELFNKHRGELPDPSKATPGFREPRKLKVEFAALDAKAERVTRAIPAVKAVSMFLCTSAAAGGVDAVSALTQAAQPGLAETMPIREAVSQRMEQNRAPYSNIERWEFIPRDTSVFRPQPIVSALGMLAGGPDVGTLMGAAAAAHQHVEVIDHRTRIPFLLQQFLVPFNPTVGNAIGSPAFALALAPKLPPEGLYLGEITAAHKKQQRQNLFLADVRQLETRLGEILKDIQPFGPKPEKSKIDAALETARKHMDQWLKDRGLTPTVTPRPIDQYEVAAAAELKPLNDLAVSEPDGTNSLSAKLFESFDGRMLRMSGQIYTTTPFKPFWFPADPVGESADKPNHLVWVSEEIAPVSYNSLDNANRLTNGEMVKRVDRAWKLEKARALAKAEADRLADEVRAIAKAAPTNPDGVDRQLKDLAAQKGLRKFALDRLAKLKFEHEPTQARITYEAPKIDKHQVLYPTPTFADQLLDLRTQPVGSVTVAQDAPRTHYYVACEVQRFEKTIEQFREVFVHADAAGPARNPLYTQYALPEERGRAMEDVRQRLRADARLEEKEAFKNNVRDTE